MYSKFLTIKQLEQEKQHTIKLEEAKQYLRIEDKKDDKQVERVLSSCIILAEHYLCCALSKKRFRVEYEFPFADKIIILPWWPVTNIHAVSIIKGNKEIKLPVKNYQFDDYSISFKKLFLLEQIIIDYECGFSSENCPEAIKQGILMHAALLYDLDIDQATIPSISRGLYQPYKNIRI